MSDSLMAWYERELALLRQGGRLFSEQHPQLAQHLRVTDDGIDDPHVARVVESFALLTARLSRQLSEESTKISSSLLQIMFPLCLQPMPSVSMIRIAPSRDYASVIRLVSGTRFRAHVDEHRYCQFHTTRDLELCPFDITDSRIEQRPFVRMDLGYSEKTEALLKLDLEMLDESLSFGDLGDFSELTIHFKGLSHLQSLMYDLLCRDLCKILLVDDQTHQTLSLSNFSPVGFSNRDCMLTHDNTNFIDYQMMAEMFAWPELYYGFRLSNLGEKLQDFSGHKVTLVFCLENTSDELFQALQYVSFLLGCAPVINLFEKISEPVVVDHRRLEYPIVPDSQSLNEIEVQYVKKVFDISGEQAEELHPVYGLRHRDRDIGRFWLYHPADRESEQYGHLEMIFTDLQPDQNQTSVLSPHLVCNNGKQALDLPSNPKLECIDNVALVNAPCLIMRPTAPIQRNRDIKTRLDLLVHLNDNMISVLEAKNPARQLRTLMSIYASGNHPISTAWLESLVSLEALPQVASIRIGGHHCFTQGSELVVELDPVRLKHASKMMFINLLDFLSAGFAGFHSFIQVVVLLKGSQGEYIRCIRRHGYQINR